MDMVLETNAESPGWTMHNQRGCATLESGTTEYLADGATTGACLYDWLIQETAEETRAAGRR